MLSASQGWWARGSLLLALVMWSMPGCGPSQMGPKPVETAKTGGHDDHGHDEHGHDHGEHDHDHHTHGEKGPHEGAVVVVAGHKLHVELVLDAEAGKLTAYILNDELKPGTKLKQENLVVGFIPKAAPAEGAATANAELKDVEEITLAAVNPENGEAGEFSGQSDKLKGVKEFDGQLMTVQFNGKTYMDVKFEYPKGNEHMAH